MSFEVITGGKQDDAMPAPALPPAPTLDAQRLDARLDCAIGDAARVLMELISIRQAMRAAVDLR